MHLGRVTGVTAEANGDKRHTNAQPQPRSSFQPDSTAFIYLPVFPTAFPAFPTVAHVADTHQRQQRLRLLLKSRQKSSAPSLAKPQRQNRGQKNKTKKEPSVLLVSAIGNQRVPVFKLL